MKPNKTTPMPRRGDIYLVNFDPTIGAEIKKTRPALIIQNDTANKHSPVTIVAAITGHQGGMLYPTEVLVTASIRALRKDSLILLNQIRTIDKQRLVRRLGKITKADLGRVEQALAISLGMAGI